MIITFSGTGNSLLVARRLQDELGGEINVLEGDMLLNPSKHVLPVPQGEPVVWVFPVYSWGVPPVLVSFIKRAKIKADNHDPMHFLVCTCGDDIGYADNQWRKLIGRRGWSPRGTFSVLMPNTYVLMKGFDVDSDDLLREKLDAMPARVAGIADKIRKNFAGSDVVRGSSAWAKTQLVYPLFRTFCMSSRPFHTTDACTSCGLCARSCPLGNITMGNVTADGGAASGTESSSPLRPVWGNDCAQCLRCYHICPSHAIEYGRETASKGHKQVYK